MREIEYYYRHVPTTWRFSQSRKFIRALMGPFGSGKSSGCVMELVQWATRQPVVSGIRRSSTAVQSESLATATTSAAFLPHFEQRIRRASR